MRRASRPALIRNKQNGLAVWDPSLDLSPIVYQNNGKRLRLPAPNQTVAKTARGTEGRNSGKWYFECLIVNMLGATGNNNTSATTTGVGVAKSTFAFTSSNIAGGTSGDLGVGIWPDETTTNSRVYTNGSFALYAGKFWDGQRAMVAFDADSGKVYTGVNGTWHNSGNPTAGTGAVYTFTPGATLWFPAASPWSAESTGSGDTADVIIDLCNTQADCAYAPPIGFAYW